VLFDEIENGINPELMQKLVALLLGAERQVIVTTHSPLVLNYLPDEVAREACCCCSGTVQGHKAEVRLFDLPSTQRSSRCLAPVKCLSTRTWRLPAEAMTLALISPSHEIASFR
jgi:ABC-type polar amino acid transport system ATPase subunit